MLWATSASGEYPVFVGPGLLGRRLVAAGRAVASASPTPASARLYADRVEPLAGRVEVEPGEGAKTMAEAERVLRELARAGMTREDHVVALGGGVVGDLAGFCAHTYQRGVPVVQVPTTLVAQVDSAYGGKTGVDLPEGKNYAGAYHLPAAVLADTATLATPARARSLRPGFVEVLKTGLLAGGALWERVRDDRGARPRRARRRRLRLRPLQVRGRRRRRARRRPAAHVLNLGHTVGHAIEAASGYSRYRHGEAVGLGLLAALRLSDAPALARRGRGDPAAATACRSRSTPRSTSTRSSRPSQRDKKRTAAGVGFVLLAEPGEPASGQLRRSG